MFYWRCPECGGPSEMARVCKKCLERKEACTAATEQTSNVNNILKNLHFNYTTSKGAMSSGINAS